MNTGHNAMVGFEAIAISLSVLMHVAWNLIARHQPREAEPLWWVLLGHLLFIAPWGFYSLITEARWSGHLLFLLFLSASANVLYFHALHRAYQYAPVSFVYPLVRSSPILIAGWSLLLFGETLSVWAWAGIGVSVIGLIAMAWSGRSNDEGRALPWALLAMLTTSVYSLSDKAATAHIHSFSGILGYLSVGYLAAWLLMTWRLHKSTGQWAPKARPNLTATAIGSVSIGIAYALVIHAMRTLPAAEVVAFTNAGIALATVLSLVVFKERTHWLQRSNAVLVICMGLMLIGFGRAR